MERAKLNVWRLQTRQDSNLKYLLRNLKTAGLINSYRVDRAHLNMVQLHQDSSYTMVEDDATLLEMFAPDPIGYARVAQYIETGVLPPPCVPVSADSDQSSTAPKDASMDSDTN